MRPSREKAVVVVTRLVKTITKPLLASKDILKHLRFVLRGGKTLEDRMCLRRWSGLVHVKDQSARAQEGIGGGRRSSERNHC